MLLLTFIWKIQAKRAQSYHDQQWQDPHQVSQENGKAQSPFIHLKKKNEFRQNRAENS